jgi:hypothetical protein
MQPVGELSVAEPLLHLLANSGRKFVGKNIVERPNKARNNPSDAKEEFDSFLAVGRKNCAEKGNPLGKSEELAGLRGGPILGKKAGVHRFWKDGGLLHPMPSEAVATNCSRASKEESSKAVFFLADEIAGIVIVILGRGSRLESWAQFLKIPNGGNTHPTGGPDCWPAGNTPHKD